MKIIGGYFELEFNNVENYYHKNALALNTGRNALEYLLRVKQPKHIFIPFFTCDVLLEPIQKLNLQYSFYNINEDLEPIFDFSRLQKKDTFLYTNYFGLKDDFIKMSLPQNENIIIDNAQSFYSLPVEPFDTFYSPRKFFGVPDGAYLYTSIKLTDTFERDISYKRMSHLLKRIDIGAEDGYEDFKMNEHSLKNQPIKLMSALTEKILGRIDYEEIAAKRIANFNFLHLNLQSTNLMKFTFTKNMVPMTYPLLTKNEGLKRKLIDQKIFVATYWPNLLEVSEFTKYENLLAKNIIHIPIDHRITINELNDILKNCI